MKKTKKRPKCPLWASDNPSGLCVIYDQQVEEMDNFMRTKHITMACEEEEAKTLKEFCFRKGITQNDAMHCAWDYFLRASDDEQNKIITDYFTEYRLSR